MSAPTLVILAAGLGARFGGSKQFFELGPSGETFSDYSLYDAWRAGFDRALFIVREEEEDTCRDRYSSRWGSRLKIETVVQRLTELPGKRPAPAERRKPWGTAHAIWCARERLNAPFAVINADDFYGRRAFLAIQRAIASSPGEGALVAYPLGETLSDSGGVARATCRIGPDGKLQEILECRDIRRTEQGIAARGAENLLIKEAHPVSMNFWGLPPAVFAAFEPLIERLAGADDPKAELTISEAVEKCLLEGNLKVNVLREGSGWIGVTYREDAAAAAAKLRALTETAEYPASLWDALSR